MNASAFFVTGTDTSVGKTVVACALLRLFAAEGRSVVGMKPVAAGQEHGRWEDVDALVAASTVEAPLELVNPYAFDPPIAPHIAAERAGQVIDLSRIGAAFHELEKRADIVVVEGAGGLMVPLGAGSTFVDLIRTLELSVVMVVGMRLGCLNHALLTQATLERDDLKCVGWVANCVGPEMEELEGNVATLQAQLASPLLGRIPYRPGITADEAAHCLKLPVA